MNQMKKHNFHEKLILDKDWIEDGDIFDNLTF